MLALSVTASATSIKRFGLGVETTSEVKVITSGGFAAADEILEPVFEARTGTDLVTFHGSSSGGAFDSIPERLQNGQEFDVLIMSKGSMANLVGFGFVRIDSQVDLAESRIGLAGAEIPDISTPAKFVQMLLRVNFIAYSASASGRYLSGDL